jgi:hypothetical protein
MTPEPLSSATKGLMALEIAMQPIPGISRTGGELLQQLRIAKAICQESRT